MSLGRVALSELEGGGSPDESAVVSSRVARAHARQAERNNGPLNSKLPDKQLYLHARPDKEGRKLLSRAVERFALSARGYVRVLRVARTIADLDGQEGLAMEAVAEALQYRQPFTEQQP